MNIRYPIYEGVYRILTNKLSFFYLQLFICRLLCVIKHLIYEFIHIYLSKRYLFSFINHQKEIRNRLSCTYLVFKSFCYKYFVSTAQIHIFFIFFFVFLKKWLLLRIVR